MVSGGKPQAPVSGERPGPPKARSSSRARLSADPAGGPDSRAAAAGPCGGRVSPSFAPFQPHPFGRLRSAPLPNKKHRQTRPSGDASHMAQTTCANRSAFSPDRRSATPRRCSPQRSEHRRTTRRRAAEDGSAMPPQGAEHRRPTRPRGTCFPRRSRHFPRCRWGLVCRT